MESYNETLEFSREIPWEEELLYGNFRRWHVIFLSVGSCLSVVIFFCCIFKCRIPRTKQEIEADFIRHKLALKFRQQLNILKHSEMDEMDLFKALERLRNELKADTASIAQSEAFSALSFTPTGTPTYRKGSEINIGLSLEDFNVEALPNNQNVTLRDRLNYFITSSIQKLKQCT
ncbi:UNVERIFIED_CONTAM: hypothetical protein RMT77_007889 [Armadillidium vulgare]